MNQFANAHIHTQIRRYGKFDVLVSLEAFTPPSGSPHFVKMTVDIDTDKTWMPAQFHGKDLTLSGHKLDSYWGKLIANGKRRVESIAQSVSPAAAMTEAEAWKRQVFAGLDGVYKDYQATFGKIDPPHFLDYGERFDKAKAQLDKEPDARPGETPPTGQGQPCEAPPAPLGITPTDTLNENLAMFTGRIDQLEISRNLMLDGIMKLFEAVRGVTSGLAKEHMAAQNTFVVPMFFTDIENRLKGLPSPQKSPEPYKESMGR